MSLIEVKYLLKKYGIVPDEKKGQSFITSDEALTTIINSSFVCKKDSVLEIGPGIGSLTVLLAQEADMVLAVELDHRFQPMLDRVHATFDSVEILYDDILSVPFALISEKLKIEKKNNFKIVANIPYYLTSRLLKTVLAYEIKPKLITFLIQREVADRILATDGKHSKLSLSMQLYCRPQIIALISKEHFYPQPKVDSAILQLTDIHAWHYPESEQIVWQLISFGFSSKRKKLINNLSAGLQLEKEKVIRYFSDLGLPDTLRAEDMSIENWRSLTARIAESSN